MPEAVVVLMVVATLVSAPGIVVSCTRARSATRHNSARAPQRVLRWRRVRSGPFETDAFGGDDPERRPARPHRAARLLKYLSRSLRQPAWRNARQPRPRLGSRIDGRGNVCKSVREPAVRHRGFSAADHRRDDSAHHRHLSPRGIWRAHSESGGAESSRKSGALARSPAAFLCVHHEAVHVFPESLVAGDPARTRPGKRWSGGGGSLP